MSDLQRVRGTQDLLPPEKSKSSLVVNTARDHAERYGFAEVELPIFESIDVFKRPIGETTDVVAKELYTFADRGGDELALRPEGTAGLVRAYVQNGLAQHGISKLFYAGPMFRYERPQKGRQRQFTQFGCEMIGAGHHHADVEMMALGADIIQGLGLADDVTLTINTLGDADSRHAYRTALVDYLTPYSNDLSEDSQRRLEQNPLRILDSKDSGDRDIIQNAPVYTDYWNDTSREFFDGVQQGLTHAGIAYTVNPALVRGLDYYTHTVFEFITDKLGSQGTVLAGGRYDGLVKRMGGADTPAVGMAGGLERMMLMVANGMPKRPTVAVIPLGEQAEKQAWGILSTVRGAGLCAEMTYTGNMKKRLKQADKIGATHAIIVGEDEIANGVATVRNLTTGEQTQQPLSDLKNWANTLTESQ